MRYNIRFLVVLALLFPGLSIGQTNSSIVSKPPSTPTREVTDTYFGTKIIDPYRWLEDLKNPEVSAWMKGQNDFTRAVLDRLPGRDQLRARIAELDNTGVVVNDLQSFGGRCFGWNARDSGLEFQAQEQIKGRPILPYPPGRRARHIG